MTKEQKQYIVLGILGLVVLVVVLKNLVFTGGPPASPKTPNVAVQGASAQAENQAGVGPSGAAAPAPTAPEIDIDELLANVQNVEFKYDLVKGRDPMIPLVGRGGLAVAAPSSGSDATMAKSSSSHAIAVARSMILTGIMYDSAHPLAVIDNQVVEIGHKFDEDITVESIEENKVTLRVGETPIPKILEEH